VTALVCGKQCNERKLSRRAGCVMYSLANKRCFAMMTIAASSLQLSKRARFASILRPQHDATTPYISYRPDCKWPARSPNGAICLIAPSRTPLLGAFWSVSMWPLDQFLGPFKCPFVGFDRRRLEILGNDLAHTTIYRRPSI
jgi:hypothetical protein